MKCNALSIIFLLLLFFNLSTIRSQSSIIAVAPSSGTGTETDPYQIATLENLLWLSQLSDYTSLYFKQTTDIDASSTLTLNDSKGFYPIGDEISFFDGHYDGQGHIIKNLYINQSTLYGTGFIGICLYGSIENVRLINCTINGNDNSGGLIGQAWQSTVSDCFVSGTVSGSYNTGGVVGSNYDGILTKCSSNASVIGQSYTGGLLGYNSGSEISYCYTSGDVSGTSFVGGLTGVNCSHSQISNCYTTGTIRGNNYIAGLAGSNETNSIISNCYTSGDVHGKNYVGGLVGYNEMSTINNCYSSGKVSFESPDYSGRCAGINYLFSSISDSYWNIDMSGPTSGVGYTDELSTTSVSGLYPEEMKSQAAFADWDFNSTWGIIENSSYPVLKSLNNPPFGRSDTICTRNTLTLRQLLINDLDYEHDLLIIRICNLSTGHFDGDSLYMPQDINLGDTIIIEYQPGNVDMEITDTLWGQKLSSIIIYNNQLPVVLSATNISMPEDSKYVFTWNDISAYDVDKDHLSIIIAAGEHYTFNCDTLVPEEDYNGLITVNVAVTDGIDTSKIKTVLVDVIALNDAPEVNDDLAVIFENDTVTFEVNAIDRDGIIRSILIGNDPMHGLVKHSGMKITYIPEKNFSGKDSLTWHAIDDGNLLSNAAKFVIQVNMRNHAPEISSQAPELATSNTEYTYDISVTDVNQDSLIYYLSNAPEGMTVSPDGIVIWIPGEEISTSGEVILHVSDGELEDTETFTVTVGVISSNEIANKPAAVLYPNPFNNGFYVETGSTKTSILYLHNMDGSLVLTQPVSSTTWIDTSRLKAGIYVVRIDSFTLRLIKN